MPAHRLLLDTDIGSDVDDAMALALILGTPDIHLLGVTTVYGDTALRGRIARRYGKLAGRDLTVHAGREVPLSGREVWWPGHEGSLHADLDIETLDSTDAVTFLTRSVAAAPGEIDVLAIGPLTNIATAIESDPSFADNVKTLWIMGGDFDGAIAEHNLRSDAAAAEVVFGSPIPIVVCGLDITRRVRIDAPGLERIRSAGPLGATLGADIDQWWAFWNETWNVPHDPVTVLALTRPDLFTLSVPGTVEVSRPGESEGRSRFRVGTGSGHGNSRVIQDMDAAAVAEAIVAGIEAAGRAGSGV